MTNKKKLDAVLRAIQQVIDYPPPGHERRTKDGYPMELIYDRFAYKRMVNSFRSALKEILNEFK